VFNFIPGAGLGLSDNAGILAFGLGHPFTLIVPEEYYALIHLIAADGVYSFSSRDLVGVVISADRHEFLEAKSEFPRQFFCVDDRVRKFSTSPYPAVQAISSKVVQIIGQSDLDFITGEVGKDGIAAEGGKEKKGFQVVFHNPELNAKLRQ
jgi:hypothetical protein